jgi:hypothetical protein
MSPTDITKIWFAESGGRKSLNSFALTIEKIDADYERKRKKKLNKHQTMIRPKTMQKPKGGVRAKSHTGWSTNSITHYARTIRWSNCVEYAEYISPDERRIREEIHYCEPKFTRKSSGWKSRHYEHQYEQHVIQAFERNKSAFREVDEIFPWMNPEDYYTQDEVDDMLLADFLKNDF